MDTPTAAKDDAATRSSLIVQFVRFWSANMDMVHSKNQSWPGFSYTDDEKAQMHTVARGMPSIEFFCTMALAAIFTLMIAAVCVGLMFWHLNARYGGDPSKAPPIIFFFCLAISGLTTLSGGIPLSILAGSWITSRLFKVNPAALPDVEFSRRLFSKILRQFIRMGIFVCAGSVIYWLFVPSGSKLDLFLHALIPILAPFISVLTFLYYFSGRVSRTADEADANKVSG